VGSSAVDERGQRRKSRTRSRGNQKKRTRMAWGKLYETVTASHDDDMVTRGDDLPLHDRYGKETHMCNWSVKEFLPRAE